MFDTVGGYIKDVRTLLQDTVPPLRYSTASLVAALNVTLLRVRELRADLMAGYLDNVPQFYIDETEDSQLDVDPFTADNADTLYDSWVPMEQQFRPALIYGIAGHAMLRDQEDIEDQRATNFIRIFERMLIGTAITPAMAPAGPRQGGSV